MKKPLKKDQSNIPFNSWMNHITMELEKNYIKLAKIRRKVTSN